MPYRCAGLSLPALLPSFVERGSSVQRSRQYDHITSLWPDAKETCRVPRKILFCRYHSLERVIGSGSGSPPNPPNEIRQNRKRNNRERVNHRAPNVRSQAEAQAHVRSSARNQSGRVNSNCGTDECD